MDTFDRVPYFKAFRGSAEKLDFQYLEPMVIGAFQQAYVAWLLCLMIIGEGSSGFYLEGRLYSGKKNKMNFSLLQLRDLYLYCMLEMASCKRSDVRKKKGRQLSRETHLLHILQNQLTEPFIKQVLPPNFCKVAKSQANNPEYFDDKNKKVRQLLARHGVSVGCIDCRSKRIRFYRGFAQVHNNAHRNIGDIFIPDIVARPVALRWKQQFGSEALVHFFICKDVYGYLKRKNPTKLPLATFKGSSLSVLKEHKSSDAVTELPCTAELMSFMSEKSKLRPV